MDLGSFNLFIKLIKEEYNLTDSQILKVAQRLLADDQEFERVWLSYKNKSIEDGVDAFRPVLQDLLSQ